MAKTDAEKLEAVTRILHSMSAGMVSVESSTVVVGGEGEEDDVTYTTKFIVVSGDGHVEPDDADIFQELLDAEVVDPYPWNA